MELQFEKKQITCLHTLLREAQTQEQTQEVRISDGMPDIGEVIGAWGQVILRSKQYSDGQATVNGGVMVWAMYRSEEGGQVCPVESWIPFQLRWDLPASDVDGTMHLQCVLRSVDARSTSARKLMLRANVNALLHTMQPQQREIFVPSQLPADIQLKKSVYPVKLPVEAGEKAFTVEETQNMPSSGAKAEKIISYRLQPEILDKKVMSDKVVFRGCGLMHLMYLADDGEYYSCDLELPFSQYAQLDTAYAESAFCSISPLITTMEAELVEGQLKLKAGLSCQYVICQEETLEITEDAYSPYRDIQPQMQSLQLPVILDDRSQTLHLQAQYPVQGQRVVDGMFYPDIPAAERDGDKIAITLPGYMQMLYYDPEGQLQCSGKHVHQTLEVDVDRDAQLYTRAVPTGKVQGSINDSGQLQADLLVGFTAVSGQGIPMVTALEVGADAQPDPNRPSLILLRCENTDLWETAKAAGSTVDAICKANALEAEPDIGQILLIPVL